MKKLRQIKNYSILLFCMFFFTQGLIAQNVEKWYVNMPAELNPTLSKQSRLELLEYYKAGQSDSVTNYFGNEARLLVFDSINQCLVVKNTINSIFEMKMFELKDSSYMFGLISTVCCPICQSSIQFYDTAWNLIPIQFTMPKAIDWLDQGSLKAENLDNEWVENVLSNSFITLTFNAVENAIIAKNNSLEFMSEVDRKLISPFINKKPFVFKQNGCKWVR